MLAFKHEVQQTGNHHLNSDDQEMRDNVENEENINRGKSSSGITGSGLDKAMLKTNIYGKQNQTTTTKSPADSLTIQNRNSVDIENVISN